MNTVWKRPLPVHHWSDVHAIKTITDKNGKKWFLNMNQWSKFGIWDVHDGQGNTRRVHREFFRDSRLQERGQIVEKPFQPDENSWSPEIATRKRPKHKAKIKNVPRYMKKQERERQKKRRDRHPTKPKSALRKDKDKDRSPDTIEVQSLQEGPTEEEEDEFMYRQIKDSEQTQDYYDDFDEFDYCFADEDWFFY